MDEGCKDISVGENVELKCGNIDIPKFNLHVRKYLHDG